MFDAALREIVKPVDNYIRDWQHTLVSSGVATTQIACVLNLLRKDTTLKRNGIGLDTLQAYSSKYEGPQDRAKINPNWFSEESIGKDHMKVFISDVLAMLPLLVAFLQDVVAPHGVLREHIECLQLLALFVSLLQHSEDIRTIA